MSCDWERRNLMPNPHAAINPKLISVITGQDLKTVKEKPTFAMLPGQYAGLVVSGKRQIKPHYRPNKHYLVCGHSFCSTPPAGLKRSKRAKSRKNNKNRILWTTSRLRAIFAASTATVRVNGKQSILSCISGLSQNC